MDPRTNLVLSEIRKRLDEATGMDSDSFMQKLKSLLTIGDRYLKLDNFNQFDRTYGTVFVTFINLPGGEHTGADAMNNRLVFQVTGFGKEKGEPSGKVKVEAVTGAPKFEKLRAKSGDPEKIAKYIADYLNRLAKSDTKAESSGAEVSDTIIAQMGGLGKIRSMLGATVKYVKDGIGIRWPNKERSKGNYVEVVLNPDDTYSMTFFSVSSASAKKVKEYSEVYAEDLVRIFEDHTGWRLRL